MNIARKRMFLCSTSSSSSTFPCFLHVFHWSSSDFLMLSKICFVQTLAQADVKHCGGDARSASRSQTSSFRGSSLAYKMLYDIRCYAVLHGVGLHAGMCLHSLQCRVCMYLLYLRTVYIGLFTALKAFPGLRNCRPSEFGRV